MNLKSTLDQYIKNQRSNAITLGDQKDEREILRHKLEQIVKRANLMFWICAVIGIIIFIGFVAVIYHYIAIDKIEQLKILFATTGLSLSGLIWYMHRLWREKVSTELTIVLTANMTQKSLEELFKKLIAKM